jgi:hypothetical protein
MKWTEEKPTQEGVYWFRGLIGDAATSKVHDFASEPTVVKIHDNGSALYAKIPGEDWWPLIDTANGLWAGPIEPPKE